MRFLHFTQRKLSCKTSTRSDHSQLGQECVSSREACSICDTVCLSRFHTSALSIIAFVKVLTGRIDDEKHVGKLLVYLEQLLKLNPDRHHVYGALTNLQYATMYYCKRGHGTSSFEHTQAVDMNTGTNVFGCVVHVAIPLTQCTAGRPNHVARYNAERI